MIIGVYIYEKRKINVLERADNYSDNLIRIVIFSSAYLSRKQIFLFAAIKLDILFSFFFSLLFCRKRTN